MTSELKPCPFCGDKAEIERYGDRRVSTIYTCNSCGCSLETGEEWDHGSGWNTRAVPDVPELVRYSIVTNIHGWDHEECKYGEYVRYYQAVVVIAAKETDRIFWENRENAAVKRAEAAETKLAQSEKPEPVGVFGQGCLVVGTGSYLGVPAVFVWPAPAPGSVGAKVPDHLKVDHGDSGLVDGGWFMTFLTDEQALRVADALCNSSPVASDADMRAENEKLRVRLNAAADDFDLIQQRIKDVQTERASATAWQGAKEARAALNPSEPRT